ncbi:relaxase/mobilization nuclease domain-containing protein [Salegentibacter sp. BLCTC]|uniref:Relaxase/Mobilisation nuclease domain-containing protein n=1 Tax=Salegentibacter echinorum TaxID=1073325 RepID=A0A1M5FR56_SALEC|nr:MULTISPECIES: relaxase/mobilization nuclease domain-containing protein [Salegentibacter]MBE7639089.1 relaxase/mobilization nuclease domain-containing protein [Salegentibacter sp. BLCTC]SHF93988.1 Relaxase/Mobilisation nuclease domain-containing protein [Salegentibacter echinorum]
MIGKGHSVSGTRVSISYGWNQEKDAEVVLREHLAGDTPAEITEEFRIIQSQNERCINNTLSFIVSPTIEDGKDLSKKELEDLAKRFIKEMKLQDHQSIGFVHRDKAHTHVHIYTNRIGFDGKAYNDSFIGKRSQIAADNVAKELGLTRVREVQKEKLHELKHLRQEIKNIHDRVLQTRPRSLDEYISKMKALKVEVMPTINKANQLQGFRVEYKGVNLKASEVDRSMSGNRLIPQIAQNRNYTRLKEVPKTFQVLDKTVQLSSNLSTKIAKEILKGIVKTVRDTGIGMGY